MGGGETRLRIRHRSEPTRAFPLKHTVVMFLMSIVPVPLMCGVIIVMFCFGYGLTSVDRLLMQCAAGLRRGAAHRIHMVVGRGRWRDSFGAQVRDGTAQRHRNDRT